MRVEVVYINLFLQNGRSFFIRNQAQFARELLPHYYKHNNMASFVRQLNMCNYFSLLLVLKLFWDFSILINFSDGFHKKVSVELGGLKCDRDEMEFAHQYFCKDHPYLLDHIKRKVITKNVIKSDFFLDCNLFLITFYRLRQIKLRIPLKHP